MSATQTVTMEEESRLVTSAQRGDVAAYEQLIAIYAVPLQTMLARLLGDVGDPGSLATETFVSAWRALADYPPGTRFVAWLFQVALTESRRPLPGAPSPTEAGIEAEMERFVAELPARLRAVVVLRDIHGLSNQEAATALGLELAECKRRLHAARMAITARLELR